MRATCRGGTSPPAAISSASCSRRRHPDTPRGPDCPAEPRLRTIRRRPFVASSSSARPGRIRSASIAPTPAPGGGLSGPMSVAGDALAARLLETGRGSPGRPQHLGTTRSPLGLPQPPPLPAQIRARDSGQCAPPGAAADRFSRTGQQVGNLEVLLRGIAAHFHLNPQ